MVHDIVMGLRAAMALLAMGVFLRVLLNPGSIDAHDGGPAMLQWQRWSVLMMMGGLAGISLAHMAALAFPALPGMGLYSVPVLAALASLTAGITMIKIWVTRNHGCPAFYAWPIAAIPVIFVLVAVFGTTP